MPRPQQTVVLYDELNKVIIAEVYKGEEYNIPANVKVYNGSKAARFLSDNPDYVTLEEKYGNKK